MLVNRFRALGWCFISLQYFQPVSEEFQNGEGFGYIVAFRANGTRGWKEKMVTSADSTTYKYRDETFPPLTPFEVKVGVYNNKGDGPFSKVVIIHSAEGGEFNICGCMDLKSTQGRAPCISKWSPLCVFTEPREAPSDVKAYSISSSEIRVTWKPPNPGPGRPKAYEVFVQCLRVHVWFSVHTRIYAFAEACIVYQVILLC